MIGKKKQFGDVRIYARCKNVKHRDCLLEVHHLRIGDGGVTIQVGTCPACLREKEIEVDRKYKEALHALANKD